MGKRRDAMKASALQKLPKPFNWIFSTIWFFKVEILIFLIFVLLFINVEFGCDKNGPYFRWVKADVSYHGGAR